MSGCTVGDDSSQRVVSIVATMTFSFLIRLIVFIFTKRK